jgi:hypothetical protein
MSEHVTAQDLFDELSAPFPVEMIDWRVGPTNEKYIKDGEPIKGQPLCYIDARAVMDRFDAVCGPDGWQNHYTAGVGGSIVCNIGVRIEGDWIWKADGAGATDMEGEKGALSDAFKRAAVRWGVGRYLYDLKAPRIVLEKRGKSVVIPDGELAKLNTLHEDFAQKAGWGIRAGIQAYKLLNAVVKEYVVDPATAQEFRDKNKGMIPQLPVAMRRHLNETLDRAGAPATETAA